MTQEPEIKEGNGHDQQETSHLAVTLCYDRTQSLDGIFQEDNAIAKKNLAPWSPETLDGWHDLAPGSAQALFNGSSPVLQG